MSLVNISKTREKILKDTKWYNKKINFFSFWVDKYLDEPSVSSSEDTDSKTYVLEHTKISKENTMIKLDKDYLIIALRAPKNKSSKEKNNIIFIKNIYVGNAFKKTFKAVFCRRKISITLKKQGGKNEKRKIKS